MLPSAEGVCAAGVLKEGISVLPDLLQVGMRYFNKRTNKYHSPIVNLDKLWTLVGDEVQCCHAHHALSYRKARCRHVCRTCSSWPMLN